MHTVAKTVESPLGDGHAKERIVAILQNVLTTETVDLVFGSIAEAVEQARPEVACEDAKKHKVRPGKGINNPQ